MPPTNSIDETAQEVARLDRAAKTAKERVDEAKVRMMVLMDAHNLTKVRTTSGRALITLINGERLDVDWTGLNERDSETASKVRVEKADLNLWRAAVAAGIISTDLAASVTTLIPYRQLKVTRS